MCPAESKSFATTGVHAKSSATSEIFILVTELMASTILASHIWLISCSFELYIWFIWLLIYGSFGLHIL